MRRILRYSFYTCNVGSGTVRFSERHGFKTARQAIQIDSMDDALRTSLWNVIYRSFLAVHAHRTSDNPYFHVLSRTLQLEFFKLPIDEIPHLSSDYITWIKKWIFSAEWYEVYDLVEFLRMIQKALSKYNNYSSGDKGNSFEGQINSILEQEKSGYRFVGDHLSSIVDSLEISAIDDAAERSTSFAGAREHIRTALQLYASRREPDYRNSIKEAISAIESAACVITGDPKATLGKALSMLERSHDLPPAMKEAFSKLYGYASGPTGIRHAMFEEPNVTEAEARFMLVACSAFLNFLISASAQPS